MRPATTQCWDDEGVRPTVALLRPPVVVLPGSLATHGPTPPIGLAYVAAALRHAGHEVQLIDAPSEDIERCEEISSPVGTLHRIGLSPAEVAERVSPSVTLVGITNMFLHEWPQVRELAERVKARLPHVFLVIGGENATADADRILDECAAIDCCVLGEGEATIVELAERLAVGAPLDGLGGIACREGGSSGPVTSSGLPIRIGKKALREIPRPAWDLIDLDAYWSVQPFFGVNRGRAMQVLGTRGCPYKCSFCSSPQMWTTRYVAREPEDVVDEIAGYVEHYGVENVNFVDLTAATNRRWTLGLCDAIDARGLDIDWQLPVGTRIEAIDAEVLARVAATGCRNITFAPESGSPRMLEVMDKRADLDHILQAVGEARAVGLRTTVNIIIGHPAERSADTWASMRYLARCAWAGADDTAVIMFCPYPGSADHDALVASGRHVRDERSLYVGLSRSSGEHQTWNDHMSARRIRVLQLVMIGGFYGLTVIRRPRRAWEFVKAQVTGRETTYLDQMVRTRRRRMRPTPSEARPAATSPVASRRPGAAA